jgi:dTDP-4-dehydrorhamnose reductase
MALNALIIGGRGMLGIDLAAALEGDAAFDQVIVADLPECDITDEDALREFVLSLSADVIFNCAAFTNVDGCETQRNLAFAVNGTGAGNLAAVAAEADAHLIHLSTDFVFDGTKATPYEEGDPTSPVSAYGESKLEGERLVQERGDRWTIARTAWLYGRHGRNFVDTMLRLGRERDSVQGVTDQIGCPTWTCDLSAALVALAKAGAQGVFHTVNAGSCSRLEQIGYIFDMAGVECSVEGVGSSAFPRPAKVPANSTLSILKLGKEVGHEMPAWQDALTRYLSVL